MTALAEMTLPYPPPLSACFTNVRKRGRVKTQRYKAWQQHAAYTSGPQPHIPGRVQVVILATPPDLRKRDLDNLLKPSLDFLTDKGVIEDDSLVEALTIRWCRDGAARMAIMVMPFVAGQS